MCKRVCLLAFLLLILLVVVVQTSFSQRPIPGTIRVDVTAIPVDVIVTDSQGRSVSGLSPTDFVVLENGVRQEINHFSVSRFGTGPRLGEVTPKTAVSEFTSIPVLDYRNFLIVLGVATRRISIP